jgi:hypothetical protein
MNEAGHGFQCRALADAVAPEEAHDLPSSDLERDAVQNMAFAVIGVDVLDLEERLRGGSKRAHVFR